MKQQEPIEGILQDASVTYTITDIQTLCVVDTKVIEEMVLHGILEPQGTTTQTWVFEYSALSRTQKALRLHRDLEINWQGIALALELLEEVQELRQALIVLKQHS
jgi:chaperone modulatory protein CbpM